MIYIWAIIIITIMTQSDLEKPLFSLTVGEFLKHLKAGAAKTEVITTADPNVQYVYGYEGGMKLFGCSRATLYRLIKSQRIAPAVRTIGRKIIIDSTMAMELIGQKQGGRK